MDESASRDELVRFQRFVINLDGRKPQFYKLILMKSRAQRAKNVGQGWTKVGLGFFGKSRLDRSEVGLGFFSSVSNTGKRGEEFH